MRYIVGVLVVVACELRPAPKHQVSVAAGEARCNETAEHVAQVLIANATDDAQRGIYEQERDKVVRGTAEACTSQQWSIAATECYLAAKTPDDIKACEQR
jgi:hypothetical protein